MSVLSPRKRTNPETCFDHARFMIGHGKLGLSSVVESGCRRLPVSEANTVADSHDSTFRKLREAATQRLYVGCLQGCSSRTAGKLGVCSFGAYSNPIFGALLLEACSSLSPIERSACHESRNQILLIRYSSEWMALAQRTGSATRRVSDASIFVDPCQDTRSE
jgi:hypothetical protein